MTSKGHINQEMFCGRRTASGPFEPQPFEAQPFEAVLPELDDDERQTGDEPHEHHRAHLGATAIRTGFHPPVPEGVYCWKGHLIDLEALFCPICGVSMNQRTLEPVPAIGSPYVPDEDALSRAVQAAVKPGILAFNPQPR